jgi:hypothetical protein
VHLADQILNVRVPTDHVQVLRAVLVNALVRLRM